MKPSVSPTSTSCATSTTRLGPSKPPPPTSTVGATMAAVSPETAMRTRSGTLRWDMTGAVVNRPRTRKKGSRKLDSQPKSWASVIESISRSRPGST